MPSVDHARATVYPAIPFLPIQSGTNITRPRSIVDTRQVGRGASKYCSCGTPGSIARCCHAGKPGGSLSWVKGCCRSSVRHQHLPSPSPHGLLLTRRPLVHIPVDLLQLVTPNVKRYLFRRFVSALGNAPKGQLEVLACLSACLLSSLIGAPRRINKAGARSMQAKLAHWL